jgi:hypothetical protein
MCGADDCEKCHPENFDSRGRYLPDISEDNFDDFDDYCGIDEESSSTQEVCWESKY